ncbi:gamma-glutamyltransferase family protein [Bordetella sp. BOR01]|uniref:gamma-glutamyltransferase family protein n=1 Tax=Bordetella sp. BOR01 TaxID=2854779 RepID=UPI001C497460|nr:gamma-glutamyltransferase [Bordetella sp. BOR01]MBV7481818.1 gamma-glutamyltransferase [Bordetella sp. BOR01]
MRKIALSPASVSWRPTVMGAHHAVACGHYLAAAAASQVLASGGNAVDAGVTMAMALAVLQPDVVSFAGVAPTLIYMKETGQVASLAGLGYWPALTDVGRLRAEGGQAIPEGILRQIVPAAPATHILALRRFGTISFEAAATPALQLARDGFAMYPELRDGLDMHGHEIARYRENAAIYLPDGKVPAVGSRFRQENLGRTIGRMIEAERQASGDRDAKLRAVHDCFYRGPIARDIDAFHRRQEGFLRYEDLARFEVPVETPISCAYQGSQVYACDVWCQGIVLLQALKILEPLDLAALGHNTPAYLHTIASALNLAFADREAYVGDPRFVQVPTRTLLSEDYAQRQRARLDPARAFAQMPASGDLGADWPPHANRALPADGAAPVPPDTIYGCVVDSQGNAMSITPSDTMYDSPMVDGLGLAISTRGMQGRLEPDHPCSVAPGKRPRLTPTPAMSLREGRFEMAWGTPGGDVQCASMLQVLLNVTRFGMTLQQAIEAPRVAPFNFPNSFAPNAYYPARLCVENRIDEATVAALIGLGYDVEYWSDKSFNAGAVCAIRRDAATGLLHAGADPRRAAYAIAW